MNILTFDIEEWFHILDNNSTKTPKEWTNYESRINSNMDKIFRFLDESKLKATFFIVGWIADKYPNIVKQIDSLGHEIGSHTYMHQLMYEQSKKQIEEDLNKSIDTLETITGKKIRAFRAPGFSITEANKVVFEVLAKNGITHDCSVFPANRAHGGFSSYKNSEPSIIEINNYRIKEFPINTISIFGYRWIFSGGGYFRLTPLALVKHWTKSSDYVMTYFHPRDFDPKQPVIKDLSSFRKFKSYTGLNKCMNKLKRWTAEFDFVDLASADELIDWGKAPIIRL